MLRRNQAADVPRTILRSFITQGLKLSFLLIWFIKQGCSSAKWSTNCHQITKYWYLSEVNQGSRKFRRYVRRFIGWGDGWGELGRAETQARLFRQAAEFRHGGSAEAVVHRQDFFFWGVSALLLSPFNWWNQTCPDYLASSPYFKVTWIKQTSFSLAIQ